MHYLHEDPDWNHMGQDWTEGDYAFGCVDGGIVLGEKMTHTMICDAIADSAGQTSLYFWNTTLNAAKGVLAAQSWLGEAASSSSVLHRAAVKNVVALLNTAWTNYWKAPAPGGGIMPQKAPVSVLDGVGSTRVMLDDALAIDVMDEKDGRKPWYSAFVIYGPKDPEDDDKHVELYGGYDAAKAVEHLMYVEAEWRAGKRVRPGQQTVSNPSTSGYSPSTDNPRVFLAPCGRIWTDTGVVAWWARKAAVSPGTHTMLTQFMETLDVDIRDYVHEYLDGTDNTTRAMSDKHVADILRRAHVSPQGLSPSQKAVVDKWRGTPAEPAQPRGLGGYEKQGRDQGLDFRRLGDSVDFLGLF